jgi:hypothetical protein
MQALFIPNHWLVSRHIFPSIYRENEEIDGASNAVAEAVYYYF